MTSTTRSPIGAASGAAAVVLMLAGNSVFAGAGEDPTASTRNAHRPRRRVNGATTSGCSCRCTARSCSPSSGSGTNLPMDGQNVLAP